MQIRVWYQLLMGILLYLQRMRILFSHILSPHPHVLQREQKKVHAFMDLGGHVCPLALLL